jgi:hypothetical protein
VRKNHRGHTIAVTGGGSDTPLCLHLTAIDTLSYRHHLLNHIVPASQPQQQQLFSFKIRTGNRPGRRASLPWVTSPAISGRNLPSDWNSPPARSRPIPTQDRLHLAHATRHADPEILPVMPLLDERTHRPRRLPIIPRAYWAGVPAAAPLPQSPPAYPSAQHEDEYGRTRENRLRFMKKSISTRGHEIGPERKLSRLHRAFLPSSAAGSI